MTLPSGALDCCACSISTKPSAAETLGRQEPFSGKRLAILTNGGGIGVLAVDRLIDLGGVLARISDETLMKLDRLLPPSWSRANPVDIIGDADALRYAGALEALLADKANDAILVMNVPTALASAPVAAATIVETIKRDRTHHDPPTDLILAHSSKDIVDIFQPLNRVADLRFTISSEEGLD